MDKYKKFNFFNRRQFISSILSVSALTNLPKISLASDPEVIVIGAGASGLAATEYLLKKGKSVICIEANNRIGGRCYTDNAFFGVPYDMWAHCGLQITKPIHTCTIGMKTTSKVSICMKIKNMSLFM